MKSKIQSLVVRINNEKTFRDIIGYNLKILFVGLNPSPVSIKRKHYHQGKSGRRFWDRLKQYGILSNCKEGKEDESLKDNGYGITDIVKRPTRNSSILTEKDYSVGRERLKQKLLRYKPRFVCFIYKKAAEEFLNRRISDSGPIDIKIGNSLIFILPSMYANNSEVTKRMNELRKLLNKRRAA